MSGLASKLLIGSVLVAVCLPIGASAKHAGEPECSNTTLDFVQVVGQDQPIILITPEADARVAAGRRVPQVVGGEDITTAPVANNNVSKTATIQSAS